MDWDGVRKDLIGTPERGARHLIFLYALAEYLQSLREPVPFVVGGNAVEYYTSGSYATGDLDLKCNWQGLLQFCENIGLDRNEGQFFSKELNIYIDWLGSGPEAPHESDSRAVEVGEIDSDVYFRLISPEDIVLSRLLEAKFWNNEDARLWAERIVESVVKARYDVDWGYLEDRAAQEDVVDEVTRLSDFIRRISRNTGTGNGPPKP